MSRSHRGISLKSLPLVPATEQAPQSKRERKVRRAYANKYGGSTAKLPSVGSGRGTSMTRSGRDPSGHEIQYYDPNRSLPATELNMPRLYYCPYCDTVVPDAADLRKHLKRCALSSRRESNSNYATCKLYLVHLTCPGLKLNWLKCWIPLGMRDFDTIGAWLGNQT